MQVCNCLDGDLRKKPSFLAANGHCTLLANNIQSRSLANCGFLIVCDCCTCISINMGLINLPLVETMTSCVCVCV